MLNATEAKADKGVKAWLVTVEVKGIRTVYLTYAKREKTAVNDAMESEYQAWSGHHVPTLVSVMQV